MGSNDFLSVYPYSFAEAKRLNELDRWKESHKENMVCKNAIEEAIRRDFDGMHLHEKCAKDIITQFGYHRTAYVLANSLQQKDYDGRFSHGNHHWAKQTYTPLDRDAYTDRNADFAVDSHPAVLDGFVNQFRRAYQTLGMFDHTHCQPDTAKQDFEGNVIVLSADVLNERSLAPESQLWLCTGGFGSRAGASGRGVFATCLFDGEKTRWNREDFVGVLADSQLPDWAREKLQELRAHEQTEAPAPEMGGMTMQ
jgi:hypothetical protein